MKAAFIIGFLLVFSGSSQAVGLGPAVNQLLAEFRVAFSGMITQWEGHALVDTESCQSVHQLLNALPPMFELIASNPSYQSLRDEVTAVGVAWDSFISDYLKPAFGLIPHLASHSCTGTRGGAIGMVVDIRTVFGARRPILAELITSLQATSPEFADLMRRIGESQELIKILRCTPEAAAAGVIYRAAGFDVDGVIEMIVNTFGWTVTPC